MRPELSKKHERLRTTLGELGRVAIAFSGGVDSTLLAKVAHDVLGSDMVAITAELHATPTVELHASQAWCAQEGIRQLRINIDELSIPGYAQNPPERCYLCKRAVFQELIRAAADHGFPHVVDGSNVDDDGDYRPGMRALVELGVHSPLKMCGLNKHDVRELSQELALPTWNMPSAACLASRFAYGDTITAQKLKRVEAAEGLLHDLGFGQLRVRVHGDTGTLARIEVPQSDLERLASPEMRTHIVEHFRTLGFVYVSLDLAGFRSGAMNETL